MQGVEAPGLHARGFAGERSHARRVAGLALGAGRASLWYGPRGRPVLLGWTNSFPLACKRVEIGQQMGLNIGLKQAQSKVGQGHQIAKNKR